MLCLVSCMLVVVLVCSCDVIGLSRHFSFLFVAPIPLAYSFIVTS